MAVSNRGEARGLWINASAPERSLVKFHLSEFRIWKEFSTWGNSGSVAYQLLLGNLTGEFPALRWCGHKAPYSWWSGRRITPIAGFQMRTYVGPFAWQASDLTTRPQELLDWYVSFSECLLKLFICILQFRYNAIHFVKILTTDTGTYFVNKNSDVCSPLLQGCIQYHAILDRDITAPDSSLTIFFLAITMTS